MRANSLRSSSLRLAHGRVKSSGGNWTEVAGVPIGPAAERPAAPGRREVHLVLGSEVPLADRGGAESVVDQHLGHSRALARDMAVAVREPGGRLSDARHAVGRVV